MQDGAGGVPEGDWHRGVLYELKTRKVFRKEKGYVLKELERNPRFDRVSETEGHSSSCVHESPVGHGTLTQDLTGPSPGSRRYILTLVYP